MYSKISARNLKLDNNKIHDYGAQTSPPLYIATAEFVTILRFQSLQAVEELEVATELRVSFV